MLWQFYCDSRSNRFLFFFVHSIILAVRGTKRRPQETNYLQRLHFQARMGTRHLLLWLQVTIKVQVNTHRWPAGRTGQRHRWNGYFLFLQLIENVTCLWCPSGGSGPSKSDIPGKSLAHMTSVESDSSDRWRAQIHSRPQRAAFGSPSTVQVLYLCFCPAAAPDCGAPSTQSAVPACLRQTPSRRSDPAIPSTWHEVKAAEGGGKWRFKIQYLQISSATCHITWQWNAGVAEPDVIVHTRNKESVGGEKNNLISGEYYISFT